MGLRWNKTALYSAVLLVVASGLLYSRFLGRKNVSLQVDSATHVAHPHNHVLANLVVKNCSRLNPFSSCRQPPSEQGWIRVEKDLYLKSSWHQRAYLFAQWADVSRHPGEPVIVDITIGAPAERKVEDDWEHIGLDIYVKRLRKPVNLAIAPITAIDVLYGNDAADPRPGWFMTRKPIRLTNRSSSYEPHITFRKEAEQSLPHPTELRVKADGSFKIMQISDLHLSTGVGRCMDPYPPPSTGECEADPRTFDFLDRVIEDERPDLIVLSGDQLDGANSPDAQTAILKLANNLIKYKIPYASVFGNHDDEGDLSRAQSMSLLQTLPFSISKPGPESISGVGNYFLQVASNIAGVPALRIYLLDSGSYSTNLRYPGYDWIRADQIAWFKQLTLIHKDQDSHRLGKPTPLHLSFIHIPLPEYHHVSKESMIGTKSEGVSSPVFNSGFYEALAEAGVDAVSCGHDHLNDYCGTLDASHSKKGNDEDQGPFLCFAGGAGFGGYGGRGFVRRVRLFEVDSRRRTLKTWKRLEWGDIDSKIDEQDVTRQRRSI